MRVAPAGAGSARRPSEERMSTEEQVIGTLVVQSDHIRHLDEVAAVTSENLVVVKRKLLSRTGYELVRRPLDGCASVAYFDARPLATVLSGVLLIGLIVALVVLLIVGWRDLTPGTKVYPGLFALVALWGARRAF